MIKDLREKYLKIQELSFCPGCGDGIFINCFLEAVEESKIDFHKMVFVSGIGCAAWIPNPYFAAETIHTTHGRALAVATAIKIAKPHLKVVVISGDGDLSTIGGNHLIHSARRNVPITCFCLNNFIYGMTGGQAGATTPLGSVSSTTPDGNKDAPFDLIKLVLGAGGKFASRWPLVYPRRAIKGIRNALEFGDKGFAFVEIVSPCPVQYGRRNSLKSPSRMLEWQKEKYVLRGKETKPCQIEYGEWGEDDLILRGGEKCEKN
ncbi:MAG: 2-oxoacid:ferredoxin oxidoreductase subunit beta [Candidatus Nealsonbacteria bacterium]|nr:2-oxoacid:ferredoxin oxidoreductase subunit beta [Candidatus Nealsonbacteria bacterium]